ncbi:MAG: LlaJI family restriction endonuclease [Gemmataceae bacterium]|nr:LlaJI family restriction endonuclease [Gemmataceae bacterium]
MNFPRLSLFVAGDIQDQISKPEIWQLLVENGFVHRTTVQAVGFCRDLKTNSLVVVLPKAFGILNREELQKPRNKIDQTYLLVRIFNKIHRQTNLSTQLIASNKPLPQTLSGYDPILDSFEAALKLVQEFQSQGFYFRKVRKSFRDAHSYPINWAKTLKQSNPSLQDDEIFLASSVHIGKRLTLAHQLSELHVRTLREIYDLIGLRFPDEGFEKIGTQPLSRTPISRIFNLIEQLSHEIYDDRGQFLLRAIRAYLGAGQSKYSRATETNPLLVYSANFENIWEHLLRDQFGKSVPVPSCGQWFPYPAETPTVGIQPKLDGYCSLERFGIIFDAKDYQLTNQEKWIGSASDHYKQIIYRSLLERQNPQTYYFNILMFPTVQTNNLFEIRGGHCWPSIPQSIVFEVAVDYEKVVRSWLGEIYLDKKKELFNLIQNIQVFQARLLGTQVT